MTRKNHNNSAKQSAASVFKCTVSRVSKFSKEDPFNPGVTVDGFVCRRDGIFGGSLFVTHVNDKAFKPGQFIQATPKLQYPYNKDQIRIDKQKKKEMEGKGVVLRGNDDVMINLKENDSNFLKNFHQDTSHYYFGNKWNGTNILFYKYLDDTDTVRVSAKTKGTAFVGNTDHGPFFSLVLKALGGFTPSKKNNIMDNPPPLLKSFVEDEDLSGIAFELCGKEEPHLVKYDFDIALVPLYVLTKEGHMKPFLEKVDPKLVFIGGKADKSEQLESEAKERVYGEHAKEYFNIGPFEFKDRNDIVKRCIKLKNDDLKRNYTFRKQHNLKHKYEYDHFLTEGFVLYLLNTKGYVVPDKTIYKIKPKDVEEVHWESFDNVKKGLVKEAVNKIIQREKQKTITSLKEELDMGEKEWGKFGRDVLNYIKKEKLIKFDP